MLYAWSQFLRSPTSELPGRQVLGPFLTSDGYEFGGSHWEEFKRSRKASTAFTAAITYGPSIKALRWAGPVAGAPDAWAPSDLFDLALDAFEERFAHELDHEAFSELGPVKVTRADVQRWADLWNLNDLTDEEQEAFRRVLSGDLADERRRDTIALIRSICEDDPDIEYDALRAAMAQKSEGNGPTTAWRRLQVRQAFRYALEAWFYWCLQQLVPGPKTSDQLVSAFRAGAEGWASGDERGSWLSPPHQDCPVALMEEIRSGLAGSGSLPEVVCKTLSFCFHEALTESGSQGRADRLPIRRARTEAEAWGTSTPAEFIAHMMETWLFAQHAYWSSSRTLADARVRGKVILRLRITLDEGGWQLTQRGATGSEPYPTPDRLETAWTLADEASLL